VKESLQMFHGVKVLNSLKVRMLTLDLPLVFYFWDVARPRAFCSSGRTNQYSTCSLTPTMPSEKSCWLQL
jgi:hypothetical protein